eukprot:m.61355 g.61355  ORF g.61355 m.61355 type:complete len:76 (+) comp8023_c0_seq1:89-316(+)
MQYLVRQMPSARCYWSDQCAVVSTRTVDAHTLHNSESRRTPTHTRTSSTQLRQLCEPSRHHKATHTPYTTLGVPS